MGWIEVVGLVVLTLMKLVAMLGLIVVVVRVLIRRELRRGPVRPLHDKERLQSE